MEWVDQGIILGTKRHGESSVIAEVMTRERGRHQGLVRGGRSAKMQPLLQIGNQVEVTWRARLDEHLGQFQIEPLAFHAARLMENMMALNGLQLLASHLRLLPDRDPHPQLYEALVAILEHFDEAVLATELMARFEMRLLDELGFGLDLSQCAATGSRQDLIYVSPKSGRAVSREAGKPWEDKLLVLPQFLEDIPGCGVTIDEAKAAWRLADFFLMRDVYLPRGIEMPSARAAYQVYALRLMQSGQERVR
jgi:DNA repair protein RecO (recombination protein O)